MVGNWNSSMNAAESRCCPVCCCVMVDPACPINLSVDGTTWNLSGHVVHNLVVLGIRNLDSGTSPSLPKSCGCPPEVG